MNDTISIVHRQPTPDGPHEPLATPSARPRCQVSAGRCGGSGFADEAVRMLRSRLRVAALILLGPLAYFLVLQLATDRPGLLLDRVGVTLHALSTLVALGVAVLLWSNRPLGH